MHRLMHHSASTAGKSASDQREWEEAVLFELHIPKTGGTSLFSVLAAAVAPGLSHVAMSEQELRDRTTGFALLGGHFTWDTLAMFPEQPRVVTVLRDPIDRVLSIYGYWRSFAKAGVFGPDSQIGADQAASRTVDDLLLDPTSLVRANLQAMSFYLAGKDAIEAGRGLEAAMRNLESCAWVGTTSTLDRDIRVLPAMLGLSTTTEPQRRMVTPSRPQRADVSKEALRTIEALTEHERILYERACAIAEEQQRRYG